MSALAFAQSGRGWEDAGRGGPDADGTPDAARPAQPRLFALSGGGLDLHPAHGEPTGPQAALGPGAAPPASAPTLEERVIGAWSAVGAGMPAECPLCSGRLHPRWSAGAGIVGGRCADCATLLD